MIIPLTSNQEFQILSFLDAPAIISVLLALRGLDHPSISKEGFEGTFFFDRLKDLKGLKNITTLVAEKTF